MPGEYYYRDPRAPREVFGPFSLERLRDLVREGRLHATDQITVNGQSWLLATEFEPELFPASSENWIASQPAWKQTASKIGAQIKAAALSAWNYLKVAADFYWSHRQDLWQLAAEYVPFLKESANRREIRVSAEDHHEAVFFDGEQWHANLPDCCVVCGEPSDCDWNSEQRSVPNLTWPLLGPFFGLLSGIAIWLFLWNAWGKWFSLVAVIGGFLFGYRQRGETVVRIRFRRCRDHLNRIRIPSLRTFRNVLIIGIGDRKIWRLFYYGEREMESPMAVPPDFQQAVSSNRGETPENSDQPSYPTIPLAGDDESGSNP